MKSYLDLLRHVLSHGADRTDRTGTGTRSVFGYQWRHNLNDGFPLLTTKKVHVKSIIHELLWFLSGSTNVQYLQDNGVTIWDEWADKETGDLGPVYGKQWRRWEHISIPHPVTRVENVRDHRVEIDQIANLIRDLQQNPDSRRHIVSAWNPADIPHMKLPPCHTLWQCYVADYSNRCDCEQCKKKVLSLHLYARSIDSFLGLPFNIASYAFLAHMLAQGARRGMIETHKLDTETQVFFYEQDFYVLSNFSAFNLKWRGLTFQTSEAAYHYEKFRGAAAGIALLIYGAASAHEAFKIAERNREHQRHDWDLVRVDIMRDILRAKASQHEYVRRKLLATGDRELIEDSWRDGFWGWGQHRTGLNMLGKLWMEIRTELRRGA